MAHLSFVIKKPGLSAEEPFRLASSHAVFERLTEIVVSGEEQNSFHCIKITQKNKAALGRCNILTILVKPSLRPLFGFYTGNPNK